MLDRQHDRVPQSWSRRPSPVRRHQRRLRESQMHVERRAARRASPAAGDRSALAHRTSPSARRAAREPRERRESLPFLRSVRRSIWCGSSSRLAPPGAPCRAGHLHATARERGRRGTPLVPSETESEQGRHESAVASAAVREHSAGQQSRHSLTAVSHTLKPSGGQKGIDAGGGPGGRTAPQASSAARAAWGGDHHRGRGGARRRFTGAPGRSARPWCSRGPPGAWPDHPGAWCPSCTTAAATRQGQRG